jgi:hypothetical protein
VAAILIAAVYLCPCGYFGDTRDARTYPAGVNVATRSGSQLGAKQLSNSKGGSVTFERAEAVGTRPLHSAHGRNHDYLVPSAPCTRLLHPASLPVAPMPEAGLGSRGYDPHAQYL